MVLKESYKISSLERFTILFWLGLPPAFFSAFTVNPVIFFCEICYSATTSKNTFTLLAEFCLKGLLKNAIAVDTNLFSIPFRRVVFYLARGYLGDDGSDIGRVFDVLVEKYSPLFRLTFQAII